METIDQRRRDALVPAFVFLLGLATIGGAWVSQLAFGFIPCHLCLEQRIPYYVGLPFALAAVIAALVGAPRNVTRALLGIAGLVLAYNIFLGTYHAGVEWKWWAGPPDCSGGGGGTVTSAKDLLNQLNGIRVVSCTDAAFRFLGLSFAGWNAVISVVLTAAAAYGVFRAPSIVGDADAPAASASAAKP